MSLMLKVFISSSQDKSTEPELVNADITESWLSVLKLLEDKIKRRVDYQRSLMAPKTETECGEIPFDLAYLKDGQCIFLLPPASPKWP